MKCRDTAAKSKRVNESEGTARCSKCRAWKPIDEFVKGVLGRPHSHCKPCNSEWFAERRGTDPEKRKLYRPAYKLTEEQKRENKRAMNHMQHQARRAAGPKPHKTDIQSMMCRQDARCAYCRELLSGTFHIDHKMPVSRGGGNDLENLHITCARCNMIKGAMTHEEFLASKKRRVAKW
jgi:5-methylcytosine-specific restriction endonuclease McrA